tara:strand:+ start:227 stop:715 length:489 start_codon:yes stop_codon:yes gene_type:complete
MGGIPGAAMNCKSLANDSEDPNLIGREWNPWISDATSNAIDGFTSEDISAQYILPSGTIIATSLDSLITLKAPIVPIQETEKGDIIPESTAVFTNTTANGTLASSNTCTNWTDDTSSPSPLLGFIRDPSTDDPSLWTNATTIGVFNPSCASQRPIYCFETRS